MAEDSVYPDIDALRQDLRIRLPKSILNNLPVEKEMTKFSIYSAQEKNKLILRIADTPKENLEWNT